MRVNIVKLISTSIYAFALFGTSVAAYGQPPGDPGGGTDPDAPISGIAWLLAAGALLGIRTVYKKFGGRR